MSRRKEVYEAIDGERAYQQQRWAHSACHGTDHSPIEFLVYMRSYVNEALEYVSRNPEPEASERAMHNVRKIAALAVACMEIHGAPRRD